MVSLSFAPVNEINKINEERTELRQHWISKSMELQDIAEQMADPNIDCSHDEWLTLDGNHKVIEAQCKIIGDQMKALKDDLDSQHKLLGGQFRVSDLQQKQMRIEQLTKKNEPKVITDNSSAIEEDKRRKEEAAAQAFLKLSKKKKDEYDE